MITGILKSALRPINYGGQMTNESVSILEKWSCYQKTKIAIYFSKVRTAAPEIKP